MIDQMSDSALHKFIAELPKAELHVHLEGALQPETKLRLAKRNGIALEHSSADEIRASYDFTDLPSFLNSFNGGVSILRTEQDFYDLTFDYLSLVRSQNVLHAELHLDPQLHVSRGIGFDCFMPGVTRARVDAARDLGISSALILAMYWELGGIEASAVFAASRAYADDITAIAFYPFAETGWTAPSEFVALAEAARADGHKVTAHCNNRQPQSLETIRQCVEVLQVDRIDHGVDVVEDSKLLANIRERELCFTVCPAESLCWPGPLPGPRFASEFRTMLDQGLRITANSDDPAFFLDRYMNEILIELQKKIGLTREEVVQLSRTAFEASWLDDETKVRHLDHPLLA